jgi:hypothetical protein
MLQEHPDVRIQHEQTGGPERSPESTPVRPSNPGIPAPVRSALQTVARRDRTPYAI